MHQKNLNELKMSLRETPADKIIMWFLFGFDVDTLEVLLHELYDVLDYFILVENVRNIKNNQPKILYWDTVKGKLELASLIKTYIFQLYIFQLNIPNLINFAGTNKKKTNNTSFPIF